jgi:hypothetical protein
VRMMLCGAATPGPPTVSDWAIWNTNTALASPCASSVRSPPSTRNVPDGDV